MKLKNHFILLLLASLPNTSIAQIGFPDETVDQKWEYVTWNFWGGACEARIVKAGERVELCDDEFIEVWDCDENEIKCYLVGYYRIDGDILTMRSIEYLFDGKEYVDSIDCSKLEGLMFDFTVQENDTLVCQINSTYPPSQCDFWQEGIEIINYEGIKRETRTMRYRPHPNAPVVTKLMNWIEGIGSTVYPFYSLTCIGDHCEQEQQLTKVTANGDLIYQDTLLDFTFPCTSWITNTGKYRINDNSLELFPNPAHSYVIIESEDAPRDAVNLAILTMEGKVVHYVKSYQLGNPVSLLNLTSGSYITQVYNDSYRATRKLIVK